MQWYSDFGHLTRDVGISLFGKDVYVRKASGSLRGVNSLT
jgi:hypothetical protein